MSADRDRIRRAVDRLADALQELAYTDRISIHPEIRMLFAPNEPTEADVPHMHPVNLTAELAEELAEVVERLALERFVSHETTDRTAVDTFAAIHPELTADVTDAFAHIDPMELSRTVLDDTEPQYRMAVTRALDALFGRENEQEDGDTE